MKILHTSDWHLGVSMENGTCEPEQRRFLEWLVDEIKRREIDVLVVSGDIFHYSQPSNAARKMYYHFLVTCERDTELRQIVITGGNHDSPSGLEAASDVLEYLDCRVIGGIEADPETWSRCLVPIEGDSGEVEVIIAAVPYVPEAKLGISGIGQDEAQIRAEFRQGFADLYRTLADEAESISSEASLVACGHLTCYTASDEEEEGDYHSQIHQTGTIDFIPPSIFDPRFDYVALGHIHRMFPVEEPRIWYSGTPVPTSKNETDQRYVLVFDSESGDVARVKVPRWRDIEVIEGRLDEVLDQVEAVTTECDLPPYLLIRVEYEGDPVASAFQDILDLLDEKPDPRPEVVKFRRINIGDRPDAGGEPPKSLEELTPEQVFERMWEKQYRTEVSDEALRAFRTLLVDDSDDEYAEGGS